MGFDECARQAQQFVFIVLTKVEQPRDPSCQVDDIFAGALPRRQTVLIQPLDRYGLLWTDSDRRYDTGRRPPAHGLEASLGGGNDRDKHDAAGEYGNSPSERVQRVISWWRHECRSPGPLFLRRLSSAVIAAHGSQAVTILGDEVPR